MRLMSASALAMGPAPAAKRQSLIGLIALWALLLSPLAVWVTRGTAFGPLDPLFLFNLGVSLLWAAALHFSFSRPLLLHLLLLPLYATTATDLFLLLAFDSRLTSGYIGLALTDHADTGEMFASYWRVIVPTAVAAIAVYVAGLWLIRHSVLRPRRGLALAALALLVAIYAAYVGRAVLLKVPTQRAVMDLAQKENSAPAGVLWQLALALEIQSQGAAFKAQRAAYSFDARVKAGQPMPDLVVVVIGESARPQNWSLFGYARDTTPQLKARPGVIGLPDLLTTAPHTSIAVPSMLSLDGIGRWDLIQSRASIVRAFAEAGYSTHWLSVQPADSWAGLIPTVAEEASRRRYFDHKHDAVLLPELAGIVKQAAAGARQLIVLHTKGSHFEFSRRYPSEFARYGRDGSTHRERMVDTYDNSILYTDWVLNQAMDLIEQSGRPAVLMYASDHGENLLDDERQYFGHAIGTLYDLRTAGFFWLSKAAVGTLEPDKLAVARRHAAAPLTISDLPHSLIDIAGLTAKGFDPERSIFNPAFRPTVPRQYLVRGQLLNDRALAGDKGLPAPTLGPGPEGK